MNPDRQNTRESDAVLLQRMKNGDGSAFEVLYTRHCDAAIAAAQRELQSSPDLAQDVCQECFLVLLTNPPAQVSNGSLGGWLTTVAHNKAADLKARIYRENLSELDEREVISERTPLQTLLAIEDSRIVQSIIGKLPPEYITLVRMRFFDNCTFAVMAKQCGIPIGTALWRLNHALDLLKNYYRMEMK